MPWTTNTPLANMVIVYQNMGCQRHAAKRNLVHVAVLSLPTLHVRRRTEALLADQLAGYQ